MASSKYTIYTEKKNVIVNDAVVNAEMLAEKYFNGFFASYGVGYYQGVRENSIKIEIITSEPIKVYALINDIKLLLDQKSVLLTIDKPEMIFV